MAGPDPVAGEACEEMRLLIQADLDGELDAAATAVLAAHVADCPRCQATQTALTDLSRRVRDAATRYPTPPALRRQIEAALQPRARPVAPSGFRRLLRPAVPFGAGAALAAVVALLLMLHQPAERADDDSLDAQLATSHIRALQPGHLTDVVSTDQHTVKPWFDGRIDYAPPVPDFAKQGFPLLGGRLDYVGGRAVAVLVYGHGRHLIDVFVWPERGNALEGPETQSGYHLAYWSDHGMRCSAVSDASPQALAELARLWGRQAT